MKSLRELNKICGTGTVKTLCTGNQYKIAASQDPSYFSTEKSLVVVLIEIGNRSIFGSNFFVGKITTR